MGFLRRLYYDAFSSFYDPFVRLHSKDKQEGLRGFLVARAKVPEGGLVLDLCTGTGAVALAFAKAQKEGSLVVGLDFSRGMLRRAKPKALSLGLCNVALVQATAKALPFKPETFHAVTCSHAFYELNALEMAGMLKEARRVLRPGGRLLVMEHETPKKPILRVLFAIRMLTVGWKGLHTLKGELTCFSASFEGVTKETSPSGDSKLIIATKQYCSFGNR